MTHKIYFWILTDMKAFYQSGGVNEISTTECTRDAGSELLETNALWDRPVDLLHLELFLLAENKNIPLNVCVTHCNDILDVQRHSIA